MTNTILPVAVPAQPARESSKDNSRAADTPVRQPQVAEAAAKAEAVRREAPVGRAETRAAVAEMADYIQSVARTLRISYEEDLGVTVVRVLDDETNEVVRQIPAEEVMRASRILSEQRSAGDGGTLRGLLLDRET